MERSWRWILVVLLAAVPVARAATGGPDAGGYTWADSDSGVGWQWTSSSAAIDLPLAGDDVTTGFIALRQPFRYYGVDYTQVAICSNGWMSFSDGTSTSPRNGALPSGGAPIGTIAALWKDLEVASGSRVTLWQSSAGRILVTWESVVDRRDHSLTYSVQVDIQPAGTIRMTYRNMSLADDVTIGIENADQSAGLTVIDRTAPGPDSSYAVLFTPPAPVPTVLDCSSATPLSCGDVLSGDLALGTAVQSAYSCMGTPLDGREQLWRLDVPAGTRYRVGIERLSGNPRLVGLEGCDASRCTFPSDDTLSFTSTGTQILAVDCVAGEEGAYRLRVDCWPLPNALPCAIATTLACGTPVIGDLDAGTDRQELYACTGQALDGRELAFRFDALNPIDAVVTFSPATGSPRLFMMNSCNPDDCEIHPGGPTSVRMAPGTYWFVADCAAGSEGWFTLNVDCVGTALTLCDDKMLEMDPWGSTNGSWLVDGWLYPLKDTHDYALRVDGGATYTHDGNDCPNFTATAAGVMQPSGPAVTTWTAPEGRVDMVMSAVSEGACCGMQVDVEVTNTDSVPHSYEFRAYLDTAFGESDTCDGPIDGGPIEIAGLRYERETELMPLLTQSCGQLKMLSGLDESLQVSVQALGPHLPSDAEFLDWNEGGEPCGAWSDLAAGRLVSGCGGPTGDNSLLFIWRFPDGSGTLAPGVSDRVSLRMGSRCAFPCAACEYPSLAGGGVTDDDPCRRGIRVSWDPARFPGAGSGAYHVYRSVIGFDDAVGRGPIAERVAATEIVDDLAPSGVPVYYVVEAESLDNAGCGPGPVAGGSVARLELGPVIDASDTVPPAAGVGGALRSTTRSANTVGFQWRLAPLPEAGGAYAVFRADDDPRGPFVRLATPVARAWTDLAAPPTYTPIHCWFYDVRAIDACGNATEE